MFLLILGLVIFFSAHLTPSIGNFKENIVSTIGVNAYKGIYSLVSLLGIVAIVYGKGQAGYVELWTPPAWGSIIASISMLGTFILLTAMFAPTNIKRFTRHPMLWGVFLWGFGHLCANGDLASLLLFGSFTLFSLFGMWSLNKRGAKKSSETHALKNDAIVVGVGVILYAVVLFLHPHIAGIPII